VSAAARRRSLNSSASRCPPAVLPHQMGLGGGFPGTGRAGHENPHPLTAHLGARCTPVREDPLMQPQPCPGRDRFAVDPAEVAAVIDRGVRGIDRQRATRCGQRREEGTAILKFTSRHRSVGQGVEDQVVVLIGEEPVGERAAHLVVEAALGVGGGRRRGRGRRSKVGACRTPSRSARRASSPDRSRRAAHRAATS